MEKSIIELCPPTVKGPNFLNFSKNSNVEPHFLETYFSFEEFNYALDHINKYSAPGYDKINYEILYALPEFMKSVLLNIYNEIIENGEFPDEWRNYLCIFIPKANSNKVRPISLAPCLLKLLEKMINERLVWWIEHYEIINHNQYGFRKNKSCIESLALLISDIETQFF